MEKPEKEEEIAVVMVPLPSQSHLNQLLQLSYLISSGGLPVHFLGSATHNRQAKLRSSHHGLNPNSAAANTIHFHDLPTPPIPTPDPISNSTDKLPTHMAPAVLAYMALREPIAEFLRRLSEKTKRVVLIHDWLVAEAVSDDAVSIPNLETYAFNCMSAVNLFYILWETAGKPFSLAGEPNELVVPSVTEFFPEEIINFIAVKPEHFKKRDGDIFNTTRLIEGRYIEYLGRREIGGVEKQWAIRPTLLLRSRNPAAGELNLRRHKCMEWLDKQAPKSVVYVCFGTSVSLSEEEAKEIALGLEESKQKFLWVLRDADKADIFAGESRKIELPLGFEERVKEDGMVVRDWAPQVEILAHESVGGFMSHCGWNSCFESLVMGVPVAAWPMHSDQPLNAVFLTEVLKVGVVVREWARREEVVEAAVIGKVVERLMASEEIRRTAVELSAAVKKSMEDGGECSREMDSFIAHITR
ncbi:hypothetical protein ABFS82_10G161700 [Erythranthe guttata]|nr:PREDICTED: zeatin O-glucosyltransferase-like [Erythranthe guttata]|eukprot:XP_012828041.1 PREDICTED: zeatin O-glucosyltransferase-like [Erythranthe guttata]